MDRQLNGSIWQPVRNGARIVAGCVEDNGRFPTVNAKNNGGGSTQAAFSVRATDTAGNAGSIFPDAITI